MRSQAHLMASLLVLMITISCYYYLTESFHTNLLQRKVFGIDSRSLQLHSLQTVVESTNVPTSVVTDRSSKQHDVGTPLKSIPMDLVNSVYELASITIPGTSPLSVNDIANELQEWITALSEGLLPEAPKWPSPALFQTFTSIAFDLDIPGLTSRHRELIPALLRSLLEMSIKVENDRQASATSEQAYNQDLDDKDLGQYDHYYSYDDIADQIEYPGELKSVESTEASSVASAMRQFVADWQPMLNGIAVLDSTYGKDHGLLNAGGDPWAMAIENRRGVGLFDGIWQHSGWAVMKDIQTQLKRMTELRQLIRDIGKRPTLNGDAMRKAAPRVESQSKRASLGVFRSRYNPSELTGLHQDNSLEGMLLSEAILLVNSTVASNNTSSNRKRKLAFLSKLVENRLWSYEFNGWVEERSQMKPKPWKHYRTLPVKPGGPIIICLDSSFSMTGPREALAKSVVVECSAMANALDRECFVMSFSGSGNLKEVTVSLGSMNSRYGLQSLLDFLGHSFAGGTDVVTPLRRALDLIEEQTQWAGADILLITDGELQYPPMDSQSLQRLRHCELAKGLEVHGLLIGRNSSPALEELCTHFDGVNRVHDFLTQLDPLLLLQRQQLAKLRQSEINSDPSLATSTPIRNHQTSLYQQRPVTPTLIYRSRYQWRQSQLRALARIRRPSALGAHAGVVSNDIISQGANLQTVLEYSQRRSSELVEQQRQVNWKPSGSIKVFNSATGAAITSLLTELGEGLVERQEEVKLLLLAAITGEHLLLIGPPGTGKSELGRRLARCVTAADNARTSNGGESPMQTVFFERLLTKYTNPDELFGPLSLSALERDLYVRNTDGYLPTAHVAFIDEIFKANSAILNSMLTILNERKYDMGSKRVDVPLMTVVGASNELPESDELEALYDRFLLRKTVNPVSDQGIDELLLQSGKYQRQPDGRSLTQLSQQQFEEIRAQSVQVHLPKYVLDIIKEVRAHLRDHCDPAIYISDRRLLKAINVLKVAAYTQGRSAVEPMDLLLLRHMFWHSPADIDTITELIWSKLIPHSDISSLEFLVDKFVSRWLKQPHGVNDAEAVLDSTNELQMYIEVLAQKISVLEHLSKLYQQRESLESNSTNSRVMWLSIQEIIRLRQKTAHDIGNQLKSLRRLIVAVCVIEALGAKKLTISESDDSVIEILKLWKLHMKGIDLIDYARNLASGSAEALDAMVDLQQGSEREDNSQQSFTAADLQLSKKEAQKRFTADQFRVWKKAVKASKHTKSDDFADDDY